MPEQIAADKPSYYTALEAADSAGEAGRVDVSQMEGLLGRLLAKQLLSVYEEAKKPAEPSSE